MLDRNPNPRHSPIIQALLDMQSHGMDVEAILQDIRNRTDLDEIDATFNRHQYPNRRLVYAQTSNFNGYGSYITVLKQERCGPTALAIFGFMTRIVLTSLCCSISTADISTQLGISKPTVGKAINVLKKYFFITEVHPAVSRKPPVYMLNPCLVNVGKPKGDGIIYVFEKYVVASGLLPKSDNGGSELISKMCDVCANAERIESVSSSEGNTVTSYTQLGPPEKVITLKKKKRSSASNADDLYENTKHPVAPGDFTEMDETYW